MRSDGKTVRHNGRNPMKLSRISTSDVTMIPGQPIAIVCPDCNTWRVLSRKMIKPHRREDRGHGLPNRRCPGSGQRITFDVDLATWHRRQDQVRPDAMQPETRRAARQFYKPLPAPAPATHQLTPSAPTAASARDAWFTHRSACSACTGSASTQRKTCTDGSRLAAAYVQLLQQEPNRRPERTRQAQAQAARDRIEAGVQATRRARQWAEAAPVVERTAKQREQMPEGSAVRGPLYASAVPLEPLRPVA